MRKCLKLFAISLCALCAGFLYCSNIFAERTYPEPSKLFYVNDLANVIDAETESYIIDSNVALCAKTGGQIVVMTVESLDGEDIETYAHKVFNLYGIGDKDKDNGTLILLSVGDRQSRIELGDKTEEFITSGASGRIQDQYMIPYFKNDNWNDGLRKGFDGVLAYYQKHYNLEISDSAEAPTEYTQSTYTRNTNTTDTIAGISFFAGIIIGVISRFKKLSKRVCVISGMILAFSPFLLRNFLDTQALLVTCSFGVGLIFGVLFRLSGSSGYHSHHGGSIHSSGSSSGYSGGGGHSSGGGSSRSF